MRVLVTGHNGYIGAVMVPMLLQEGYEVEGLDCDLFADCLFPGTEPGPAIASSRKDLREVERGDLEGFDAVIHLAGLSNDPLGNLNPGLTHEINLVASARLARLAKEAGVKRFLFSSSCSTYGAAGDDFLDESAAFNPVTPYGVSKVELERELSRLADDDFTPTYLRNATAYGLSSLLRVDLVLNNLVGYALTTGKVLLLSDGTPWRPVVHIEDISLAFLAVLKAPRDKVHDQAFNVGRTEENYRIREIAEVVAEVVPGSQVEVAEGAGPDKRCYRVDCSKLPRVLPDFQPRWDIRRGAQELYDSYRRAEFTLEDLEGPAYKRLGQLEKLLASGALGDDLRWTGSGPKAAAVS